MIYLDHNATTPIHPEIEKKYPEWLKFFGNPSSSHQLGRESAAKIERARRDILSALSAESYRLVFTSGGTESNHLALNFLREDAFAKKNWGKRILISSIEHASLINQIPGLQKIGYDVREIPCTPDGTIDVDAFKELSSENTILAAVMYANNETGALQPVTEISQICRSHDIHFHCDATQAPGKTPINFSTLDADTITISAHKIYGPRGIGGLFWKKRPSPIFFGGEQEYGIRPGTENLHGIFAFAEACRILARDQNIWMQNQIEIITILKKEIKNNLPSLKIFGKESGNLSNTMSICVPGISSHLLVVQFDRRGYAVSRGSACHSGTQDPSHVLLAMGVSREEASSSIRISAGYQNRPEDTNGFITALKEIMEKYGKTD